jgi:two-component system response regulator YesN
MYHVLIVDDDPVICTGLQKLIDWNEYGYSAKDYALNGVEALKLIESRTYDLVITDIRMPKLDGIGLIQKLKERQCPSKIIILSGYREFEYARSAMEFGVKKYILKPVNEEILVNTILEMQSEIEETGRQKLVFDESRVIMREGIIQELLRGVGAEPDFCKKAGYAGVELEGRTFRVVVVGNNKSNGKGRGASEIVIKKAIDSIVGRNSAGYAVSLDNSRTAILISIKEGHPVDVLKISSDILDYVNKYTGTDVNIAIGNEVSGYDRIGESFQNACRMHHEDWFDRYGHVVVFEDVASKSLIESIIRYARDNCSEKLTLQSVSGRFFFNPAYMGRIFKNYTGMKFNDFLIDCRIEKAAKLMENENYRVCDIARKVGYTDYDHFCKVFKAKRGCTPSEYKVNGAE